MLGGWCWLQVGTHRPKRGCVTNVVRRLVNVANTLVNPFQPEELTHFQALSTNTWHHQWEQQYGGNLELLPWVFLLERIILLKKSVKVSSISKALPCDPNDRDDLSAMSFSSSLIWMTRSGETYLRCIQRESSRRSCAAGMDFALLYLLDQDTAVVLLQLMPKCLNHRFGTIFSRTSY